MLHDLKPLKEDEGLGPFGLCPEFESRLLLAGVANESHLKGGGEKPDPIADRMLHD